MGAQFLELLKKVTVFMLAGREDDDQHYGLIPDRPSHPFFREV